MWECLTVTNYIRFKNRKRLLIETIDHNTVWFFKVIQMLNSFGWPWKKKTRCILVIPKRPLCIITVRIFKTFVADDCVNMQLSSPVLISNLSLDYTAVLPSFNMSIASRLLQPRNRMRYDILPITSTQWKLFWLFWNIQKRIYLKLTSTSTCISHSK